MAGIGPNKRSVMVVSMSATGMEVLTGGPAVPRANRSGCNVLVCLST